MATNHFLEAEARERPRVAIAAGLAALLTIAAPLIVRVAVGDEAPDNHLSTAILQADHRTAVLLSAASSVLGLVAITAVLDFLLRATRARYPGLPSFVRPILIAGGLGLAAFSGVLQVVSTFRIEHFVTESSLTWGELEKTRDYGAFALIGLVAQFAFAFGFILVVLNAMRVGLLTRFMGYLGMFAAILFVIRLLPLPIVQVFWLVGLALLFWGRGGMREPPAWRSGEAMPWPSAAEVREQRVRAAEARRGGVPSAPPAPEPVEQPAGRPSPATSRRKRKKRR